MSKGLVLIADDDMAIRTVLNQALNRAGFDTRLVPNFTTLLEQVNTGEGDCIISDVIMPDGEAFEMLTKIQNMRADLPVILISAQNTFMTALKAEEAGAYEYLPKPFDLDELVQTVTRAITEPKDNYPTQSIEDYRRKMPLVGRSAPMQEVYRSIARLMHSDMAVMLSGETGTGKRLTAKVLHEVGDRKHNAFVVANLAILPEEALEGELFGREDRQGVLEPGLVREADGGTLYLDEIGELSMAAQSRLLRVLMNNEFIPAGKTVPQRIDLRVIAGTTKDMEELIEQGKFREDLYYRLNVVPLNLVPLRQRSGDIPDLARHFLKTSQGKGSQSRHLDNEAIRVLKEQNWPGNVRELENFIKRICILHPQETLTADIVKSEIRNSNYFRQDAGTSTKDSFDGVREATQHFVSRYFEEYEGGYPPDGVYQRFLQEFEYPLISNALAACNGNQIKAAKTLGLNRNTLRKKILAHGIRIIRTAK